MSNEDTWITRDGRSILITDMEDPHLIKAIAFIERQSKRIAWEYRLTELSRISRMYDSAGDASQDAMDSIIADLSDMSDLAILYRYYGQYRTMMNVAYNRHLLNDRGIQIVKGEGQ